MNNRTKRVDVCKKLVDKTPRCCNNYMLMDVKMPTIVGILTFMSIMISMLS